MRARMVSLLAVVLAAGCGGISEDVDNTVATVTPVRGTTTLGDGSAAVVARAQTGDTIRTDASGLTRVSLDQGPQLLLDAETAIELQAEGITLASGRLFAETQPGEQLIVSTEHGSLRAVDASLSARVTGSATEVYVVRGEVSWTAGEARGIASSGENLSLAGGAAEITAATLWHDWTGGLARPGPADAASPEGVGMLEARVPDEIGRARWPLVIRRLDVRVRVEGDLAVTEVDQLFFNPASETVEGLYRIRVPEGAVLQRFAVDRDDRLVDGYLREKAQARQAYEQQVYRGSTEDPALLEWDAPSSYRARIYPIYPGQTRRIVIRYAEWLRPPANGTARLYRYPMGGGTRAPHIQEFALSADVVDGGAERVRAGMGAIVEEGAVRIRRSDFRPRSDFWLELVGGEGETQRAWTAAHQPPARAPDAAAPPNEADESDYFYLPLVLPLTLGGEDVGAGGGAMDLVILADVSAGTDRSHLELGRSVVESLTAHLDGDDRVAVVSADLTIRSVVDGDAPELGPATTERVEQLLDGLARVPAGGATDIGEAIAAAAALLDPSRNGAVIYVGDGAPTVGEMRAEGLLERFARLPVPVRLYSVGIGDDSNIELLEALTRGGGLTLRVRERAEATHAALRVLAHAGRPIAHSVEVALGDGIDNAFPRRPMDAVLGEVFPVVGRVRDGLPTSVTVTGTIDGAPFSETIAIETQTTEESVDLRLRWASERLRQLLFSGAGREEVAELGTRYGLITPFTSYYVPSRRELDSMGPSASRWIDQPLLRVGGHRNATGVGGAIGRAAVTIALGPLAITGCSERSDVAGASAPYALEERSAPGAPSADMAEAEEAPEEGEMGNAPSDRRANRYGIEGPGDNAQMARETSREVGAMGALDPADVPTQPYGAAEAGGDNQALGALMGEQVGENFGYGGLGLRGTGRGGGGTGEGTIGLGNLGTIGHGGGAGDDSTGTGSGYGSGAGAARMRRRPGPASGVALPERSVRTIDLDGLTVVDESPPIVTRIVHTTDTADHRARRCSDASDLLLDDRRALWRERLGGEAGAAAWVRLYEEAIRQCEARTWRDRSAFLALVLARAGSIEGMVSAYRLLSEAGARGYVRGQILRRVRTPEDLRVVRNAFGLGASIDWALVTQVLERAPNDSAKTRALRRLAMQYPDSFELKLRLLAILERTERLGEAKRLADRLRADPLADPGVRTAIGEMFLRMEREDEARRVFSEIVEFAPLDELARRRLGDLYRAHGWFEEAYRQYQTLREIRPDDPSVLLLLAQAAAGAGRVDEALRLERGLQQTAQSGASTGVAHTALLWSSVRFARLRKAARDASDEDRLEAWSRRLRRSGILREAGALRVTLVWSHPDAQLGLWAAHPGLSLTRPTDITPEYGLEAFDLEEQEPGEYRFEVRRASTEDDLTAVTAQLVIVWNEGEDDEQIEVVNLRFDRARESYAWNIRERALVEATPGAGR